MLFITGQSLEQEQTDAIKNLDPNAPCHERLLVTHRRAIGMAFPIIFYQTIWWTLAVAVSSQICHHLQNEAFIVYFKPLDGGTRTGVITTPQIKSLT